jgi:hypothetical protein
MKILISALGAKVGKKAADNASDALGRVFSAALRGVDLSYAVTRLQNLTYRTDNCSPGHG